MSMRRFAENTSSRTSGEKQSRIYSEQYHNYFITTTRNKIDLYIKWNGIKVISVRRIESIIRRDEQADNVI
jgi:calcineurin-like phosphoesterase family protein